MKIDLDGEDGRKDVGGGVDGAAADVSSDLRVLLDETRQARALDRITAMIAGALAGTLPREREPINNEPARLSPAHINMVVDKAAGYSTAEIAERHDYTTQSVSRIISHPDAQTILSTILSASADKLTDIASRLEHLAPEALNVKVELLRHSKQEGLRNKIADDLLDRAGYGARKKIDIEATGRFVMPAQAATALTRVLGESNQIASLDYSNYLSNPNPQGSEAQLVEGPTVLEPEQAKLAAAVPPTVGSPEDSQAARAEADEAEWKMETKKQRIA